MITSKQLRELSIEDLKKLNELVHTELKIRNDNIAYDIKNTINVGSKVRVNHHKTGREIYIVVEIKRKKALVRANSSNHRYNVPLSLIQVVE